MLVFSTMSVSRYKLCFSLSYWVEQSANIYNWIKVHFLFREPALMFYNCLFTSCNLFKNSVWKEITAAINLNFKKGHPEWVQFENVYYSSFPDVRNYEMRVGNKCKQNTLLNPQNKQTNKQISESFTTSTVCKLKWWNLT